MSTTEGLGAAADVQATELPRASAANGAAPPPPPSGDADPPAAGASEPRLVAEKIDFGESEIVVYRRVEKKSCSRYMLKDMFD